MFYIIEKRSIGVSGVNMRSIDESDYRECVMELSKMLSDDGMFVISEDENNLYLKGVKEDK